MLNLKRNVFKKEMGREKHEWHRVTLKQEFSLNSVQVFAFSFSNNKKERTINIYLQKHMRKDIEKLARRLWYFHTCLSLLLSLFIFDWIISRYFKHLESYRSWEICQSLLNVKLKFLSNCMQKLLNFGSISLTQIILLDLYFLRWPLERRKPIHL